MFVRAPCVARTHRDTPKRRSAPNPFRLDFILVPAARELPLRPIVPTTFSPLFESHIEYGADFRGFFFFFLLLFADCAGKDGVGGAGGGRIQA